MTDAHQDAGKETAAERTDPGSAALHYLTGPARGLTAWMGGDAHILVITPLGWPRISSALLSDRASATDTRPLACLRRSGATYSLEPSGGQSAWVNGRAVDAVALRHGDVVEFGEDGPIARFELADLAHQPRMTLPGIVEDAYTYLQASRRPLSERLPRAVGGVLADVLHRTTLFFRVGVVLAFIAGGVVALQQSRDLARLERDVAESDTQLLIVADALSEAQAQAIRPSDLSQLRRELERQRASTEGRIATLERRWHAGVRIITAATPSVAFIEGAFAFRDPGSGALLRQVVDAAGRVVTTPFGGPLLSLTGDGPIAERAFTGTGILLEGSVGLLTNRHVALPWEHDAAAAAAVSQGLQPVMRHMNAYLAGEADAIAVELLSATNAADLALLAAPDGFEGRPRLRLGTRPLTVGDDVIVMGYATGLAAILARASPELRKSLKEAEGIDARGLAAHLAAAGLISPLSSRGIAGQITQTTVTFDADTTHGGSGGPVLDMEGAVVALQSGIIKGYGGSNLGIPAPIIASFLAEQEVP